MSPTLLANVLQYLRNNNYRRASFQRLLGIISGTSFDELNELIATNPKVFRACFLDGHKPGLALLDDVVNNGSIEAPPPTVVSVTEDDVNNEIVSVHYLNVGNALDAVTYGYKANYMPPSLYLLTICVIVLRNGYTVTGKSACVDPALYNEEIGRDLARKQAVQKIWPLLGFRLADKKNNTVQHVPV